MSDIPLSKVVAGVRVGMVEGQLVVNPTVQQMASSQLDMVLAGTKEAVLMIEVGPLPLSSTPHSLGAI